MCSGAPAKRFERRTRISLPPEDRCTIWRKVASQRSSEFSALEGSTSCCEAAHEPTHRPSTSARRAQYAIVVNKTAHRIDHLGSVGEVRFVCNASLRHCNVWIDAR